MEAVAIGFLQKPAVLLNKLAIHLNKRAVVATCGVHD
jgi:hypothetical protein